MAKLTTADLIEDIVGYPLDVVEVMLTRQEEQTGRRDVTVFQNNAEASKKQGGFTWSATPEGHIFWRKVIGNGDFSLFRDHHEPTKKSFDSSSTHDFEVEMLKALLSKSGPSDMTEAKVKGIAERVATGVFDRKMKGQPSLKQQLEELGFFPEPVTIEVKTGKKVKEVKQQHFLFPSILKALTARVNVALVGPAGSGKTSLVHNAAKALDLPFYSKSVSAQTGVHEFFGYQDAHGKFVRTLFREAYEKGGVFLVDEFDAGNPNVLAALNQATANGSCAFPDRMVDKHVDFIAVMAGNTYGTGATAEYVGRNKIDAATLDRFVFIEVPYDEGLEMAIATNKQWCTKVQQFRKRAAKNRVKCIVSPRATFNGEALLATGVEEEFVLQSVIFKNLSEDEVRLMEG